MCRIGEVFNDLTKRDLRDPQPTLGVLSRHDRVLEVGRILPTLIGRAEPVLDPPVSRGIELGFEQRDDAQRDEEYHAHHVTIQLQELC